LWFITSHSNPKALGWSAGLISSPTITKHLIRFRPYGNTRPTVGGAIWELVLLNSHDGTSA